MAAGDRKVGSLTYKEGEAKYNVLTIWESAQYPGIDSISRDKDREQYKAIGLLAALKGFAEGTGYLSFVVPRKKSDDDDWG